MNEPKFCVGEKVSVVISELEYYLIQLRHLEAIMEVEYDQIKYFRKTDNGEFIADSSYQRMMNFCKLQSLLYQGTDRGDAFSQRYEELEYEKETLNQYFEYRSEYDQLYSILKQKVIEKNSSAYKWDGIVLLSDYYDEEDHLSVFSFVSQRLIQSNGKLDAGYCMQSTSGYGYLVDVGNFKVWAHEHYLCIPGRINDDCQSYDEVIEVNDILDTAFFKHLLRVIHYCNTKIS